MLGDDIMDGTHSLLGILKHAAGNALKGAVLIGGIALAVTVGAALIGNGFAFAALVGGAGTIFDTAVGYGLIGGAVTGAASLIPGRDEGMGLRSLFKRKARTETRELTKTDPAKTPDIYQSVSTVNRTADNNPAPTYHAPTYVNNTAPDSPRPSSGSSSTGGTPQNTTYVDNSRHIYHPQDATPQDLQTPATPNEIALGGVVGGTISPPKDKITDDPNPYFKPGKGMDSLQKGNDRTDPNLQR